MMRQAHKFAALSAADRCLLLEAVALLGAIRLGLWLLPFRTLRVWLDHLERRSRIREDTRRHANEDALFALLRIPSRIEMRASPERIAWAVAVASSCVPATTCLVRALAAQVLLGRRGYPARLCIGVAKGDGGRLEAHAWVEGQQGGDVVSGGVDDHARYVALPALDR